MSLTTTAKNVKKGFWIFIGICILYLLSRFILVPAGRDFFKALFPPRNPPTVKFGVLRPIQFENQRTLNTTDPKYTLLTSNGKLPKDIPDRMTVYKYGRRPFSYEAGKDASTHAAALGFTEDMLTTSLKGNEYEWVEPTTGANLTINISSQELNLQTPKSSLQGQYKERSLDNSKAISLAKSTLRKISRFSDPLYIKGEQKVVFGKIEYDGIKPTSYNLEADIARVDFFRSIDEYPVVGPVFHEGVINVWVGQPNTQGNLEKTLVNPLIKYKNREIITTSDATYPIIPVDTAWDQIAKGKGVISSVSPNTQSPFERYTPVLIREILITDIYLAYFDDGGDQTYLQPIYVFEGNYLGSGNQKGSIALYYPAISGEYVRRASE